MDERSLLPGERVHDPDREGLMVPSERSRANGAAGVRARRLVSHRRRHSMVAAEYDSPPEIAGHAGAGVGLYFLARPVAVH
jgi:hypothetical protein